MIERNVYALCGLLVCCGLACSRDVATGRRCDDGRATCPARPSTAGDRASAGVSGEGSTAGAAGAGTVGHSDEALTVHVEDIARMTIEIVTLACAGDCADIEAVARGGHAPYAFEWEDGSHEAMRRVCLDASSELRVSATDTAIDAEEFSYEAHTATTTVSARVLDCTDAGTTDAMPCLENPSFEGPVTPTQLEAFDAPPWNACYAGGFITYSAIANEGLWPTLNWTFPPASDGETYLALGQQSLFVGRTSQTLCEPLAAGETLSFTVDLARATTTDVGEAAEPVMQVLGGDAECMESEVLWTSPPLTLDWQTYCVTLSAPQAIASIGFRPFSADGGLVEGLVDHIVPVAACP